MTGEEYMNESIGRESDTFFWENKKEESYVSGIDVAGVLWDSKTPCDDWCRVKRE